MGDIIICFGVAKSASSFSWQLVKRIAILGGKDVATLTWRSKGSDAPEDAIDPVSGPNLALVQEEIGARTAVIKTHGAATKEAIDLVKQGRSKVFVSYRDLREVALSLIDHGARSRAAGQNAYAEFLAPRNSIEALKDSVKRMQSWVDHCDPLLLPYDWVSFDTRDAIRAIAKKLEVDVSIDKALETFSDREKSIIQFNKGVRERYKSDMDDETSTIFLRTFEEYYKTYFPTINT